MPLNIEVWRGDETVTLEWDWITLSCIYTACVQEAEPDREYNDGKTFGDIPEGKYVNFDMIPIYYLDWNTPLVKKGQQTLQFDHTWKWTHEDEERVIELKAGDVVKAWRSHGH